MNKKNLPIYLSIATIFGVLIGTFFSNGSFSSSISSGSSNEKKIKRLINYIQRDYVDNVNTDNLLDGAIAEMLDKLDPHSVYIPKENLQAVKESMQGNFVGIGVQFRMMRDSILVIRPIDGGPSIKKGIKAGDRILMANNDTLFGKNMSSGVIPKYLKGKPDTKVNLQIYRPKNDSIFNVEVTRGKVNIKSVDVAYMLNDSIGYIKLDRFARNTYTEFKSALNSLLKDGMTDLVLDLRGNSGGFIDIANRIVDEFLEDDKLIVFTKNNKGYIDESYATAKGDFENGGLYVLIDENSASASEIVAGALQDNDKGTIIGRRSFGKGLVQEEMDLGDGSAVRLTTARYYTPTGRSIQKPYKIDNKTSSEDYSFDLEDRYRNGELFNKDSIKTVDSLEFKTPKGKIVYGGGGIVPDVFVAIDTTGYIPNIFYRSLNKFAFEYADENREQLTKSNIDVFLFNFDKNGAISDKYFKQFKDYNPSYRTKQEIKKYIKTVIASELFGDEGVYKSNQQDDKMLQKVFELESSN